MSQRTLVSLVFAVITLQSSGFFFLYLYSIKHRKGPGLWLICLYAIIVIINIEEKRDICQGKAQ